MALPFEKTPGQLSYDDLKALDDYYCQPYYDRDSSKISHIRDYDWVREYSQEEARDEIRLFSERMYNDDVCLAEYLSEELLRNFGTANVPTIQDIFLDGLSAAFGS